MYGTPSLTLSLEICALPDEKIIFNSLFKQFRLTVKLVRVYSVLLGHKQLP